MTLDLALLSSIAREFGATKEAVWQVVKRLYWR